VQHVKRGLTWVSIDAAHVVAPPRSLCVLYSAPVTAVQCQYCNSDSLSRASQCGRWEVSWQTYDETNACEALTPNFKSVL